MTMNVVSDFVAYKDAMQEQFYEKHGKHRKTKPGIVQFVDGAMHCENMEGMDELKEPPQDDYSRLLLIEEFWKFECEYLQSRFDESKAYLAGNGIRPREMEKCRTEDDQQEILEDMKAAAKRAQQRYWKARREATDARPEELDYIDEVDAENEAQRQAFLKRIDEIEI